jgi:hypothetical protein
MGRGIADQNQVPWKELEKNVGWGMLLTYAHMQRLWGANRGKVNGESLSFDVYIDPNVLHQLCLHWPPKPLHM